MLLTKQTVHSIASRNLKLQHRPDIMLFKKSVSQVKGAVACLKANLLLAMETKRLKKQWSLSSSF